jgi:pyruvate formate lyase activating enzyme
MEESATFRSELARHTASGALAVAMDDRWIACVACSHRCRIPPGREGICKVRFNDDGVLRVPYGYVSGIAVDPIEKKPFFHVLPGSGTLSYGMLGCDYHCAYCQNWITSQALRDKNAVSPFRAVTAEQIVVLAGREGVPVVTSTYNEPLITSEWNAAVFRLARERGMRCAYVSNGNATREVLAFLRPVLDFCKVDLKSFNPKKYGQLGGRLEAVLETIASLKEMGIWVEVVTLVVPGFNDSAEELRQIALFLAGVSPDIPWHVTAFHTDYRMTDRGSTDAAMLLRAAEIGKESGLHFVYAGNLPSRVGNCENTYCPSCHRLLIERSGFRIRSNALLNSACPSCRLPIPGVWE